MWGTVADSQSAAEAATFFAIITLFILFFAFASGAWRDCRAFRRLRQNNRFSRKDGNAYFFR